MIERRCIHHWMIDGNNIGTCKKCGEVRDFGALLVKEGRKKSPVFGHSLTGPLLETKW